VINLLKGLPARLTVVIALAMTALLLPRPAAALNPDLVVKQLRHTAWGPGHGAPLGGVIGLAQTTDGYLWVIGPSGLFRFDGVSFEHVELPHDGKLSSLGVFSIFAPRSGGLWVGFTFGGVAFLKDDHWQVYTAEDGLPPGSPSYFAETREGVLWVMTSVDLARLNGGRWKAVGSEMGLPSAQPPILFVDGQGTLWAGGGDSLFFLHKGEQRFRKQPVPVRGPWAAGMMAESSDGTVWLDTGTELLPVAQNPPPLAPPLWSSGGKSGLVFDQDGGLWDSATDGLRRIAHPQHVSLGTVVHIDSVVDSYTNIDGLSARTVLAMLVDREGNIWAGTIQGLDRFSEPKFEAPLESADRLKVFPYLRAVGLAPSDDTGGLWVTNTVDTLLRFKDGRFSNPVLTQQISCLLRAADGTVWMGGNSNLWREQQGRLEPLPPLKSLTETQAIALDKSGGLWASILRLGVFRLKDGAWTPYGGIAALPRGPAITIVRDHQDRLWFSYPGGNVAVLEGEEVRIYGAADGLGVGSVMADYPGRIDQWFGGEFGLARFDGDRFHTVRSVPELPLEGITGIVETSGGDLWLNGRMGIVHLAGPELERSRVDPSYLVRGEALGAFDGIVGSAAEIRPLPTAIQAGDGKLWFSTTGGLYGIDPARRVHNRAPPSVQIRALTVGDRVLAPEPAIKLPERTTAVRFDYVGLSLTAAEKVRYRYRLAGVDSNWRALTASRQALYTNLRPGKYTFHVIAANNDGVWNEKGASLAFSIPPAFVQTGWFLALCVAGGILAVWALVRLRVRRVAARLRGRMEAQHAERERIARELHDTLLQNFHGLAFQFQTAYKLLPARPAEAKQTLGNAIQGTLEAITEGRDAVQGLRSSAVGGNDLAAAIKALGEELAAHGPVRAEVTLSVDVGGTPTTLLPMARDEVFRIAGEALRNAFHHAGAKHIEVELSYDTWQLRLRIRDDGKGVDPKFLGDEGRPGHYGLHGMRDRAKLMGGTLDVWTAPGSGTEIDLTIPASHAYVTAPRLRRWFGKFFGTHIPIES
jgi:signal transduction histidine kinase/ligand-binding sensor domain-containing protein